MRGRHLENSRALLPAPAPLLLPDAVRPDLPKRRQSSRSPYLKFQSGPQVSMLFLRIMGTTRSLPFLPYFRPCFLFLLSFPMHMHILSSGIVVLASSPLSLRRVTSSHLSLSRSVSGFEPAAAALCDAVHGIAQSVSFPPSLLLQ